MARGRLSLLERNQRVIGTLALLVILGGTAFALLLQGGFLTQKYRVTALFTDAAGVREGDNLTVAGLVAGRVEAVRVEGGQVAMELGVQEDVGLPADSRAEVVVETLLGRKSVALLPGDSEEPLEDGDVIPLERTTTPVDIPEFNDISVELLEASDAEALETFLEDVSEITKGKAQEVQALIRGLEQVTAAVDARRDELEGLIDSLRVVSTTLGQRDQTIVSLIDNLDVVLGNLAERQDALERLLVATAGATHETADLVRRNRLVLDDTLRFLHRDLRVLDRHQIDIAAAISYLENGVQGYQGVGYSQCTRPGVGCVPNAWANIFIQSLGPLGVDAIVGECGLVDKLF
ncbi:MAG TPA: MCE family protein, partial [Actinomycetota bacterium]|nr:MCE family protein [Actinomycetota bacterium]